MTVAGVGLAGDARRRRRGRLRRGRPRRGALRSRSSCACARCATLVAGAAIGALVVARRSAASSATTPRPRGARRLGDLGHPSGPARQASAVRFIWDSNYDGIAFPAEEDRRSAGSTGPQRADYWRSVDARSSSTTDHWFEDLFWLDAGGRRVAGAPADRSSLPTRRRSARAGSSSACEVEALVDDHLVAAGHAGRARRGADSAPCSSSPEGFCASAIRSSEARRYRVWSYAPDPAPRALAQLRPAYPARAVALPRDRRARASARSASRDRDGPVSSAPRRPVVRRARRAPAPCTSVARRVAGRATDARTRRCSRSSRGSGRRGGFVYDESAADVRPGAPLVKFVTQTKAGYCQHFAGAMALMLRMLGIPARVAVGFTSGTRDDGEVGRHRPRRPRLGRGVVPGPRMGAVRPDPGPRHARRQLLVRLRTRKAASQALGVEVSSAAVDVDGAPTRAPDVGDLPAATGRERPARTVARRGRRSLAARSGLCVVGSREGSSSHGRALPDRATRAVLATASRASSRASSATRASRSPPNATLDDLRRAVGRGARPRRGAVRHRGGSRALRAAGRIDSRAREAARTELRRLIRAVRSELSVVGAAPRVRVAALAPAATGER